MSTSKRSGVDGLWRALEEDARCVALILANEGRTVDPDTVAKVVLRGYTSWPHVVELRDQLRARVSEIIRTPTETSKRRIS